jgi:NAD(P)-dependent dehydrogenase (short-subunit alcohol dehydrogenase family)
MNTKNQTQPRKETALITGSRRGIGLGIAVHLARAGFQIVLNATSSRHDAGKAIKAIQSTGMHCHYVQADISKPGDRSRLLAQIESAFGRLDILVNNAGVAPKVRNDLLAVPEESFDRLIDINLKGPFFLTQSAAKWMIELKKTDPEINPKIITISSISAYTASVSRGEYCMSKAGLSMLTALFAARLAEYDIGVFEVRPGVIETDMTAKVKDFYDQLIAEGLTPIKRWGHPDDIGRAVAAIALDSFPFSTGEVINVDGGFHLRTL